MAENDQRLFKKVGKNMTKTIKPESMKTEHSRIERWEDEGGKTLEIELPIAAGRFVKSVPKHDIPRQWSPEFVIEPLRTHTEIALTGKTRKTP